MRLDLVEILHGQPVADPYRWLEEAEDPRTKEWSEAQDSIVEARRGDWTRREEFRAALAELQRAGYVGPPVWRGSRRFELRREPEQEHAVLLVDGRPLVDPIALDPTGLTTLDGWQPSVEGDRLAYLLSAGGTEDSSLWVCDVDTGEVVEGPIPRARYTPVAWLPGGEEYFYVRYLSDVDDEPVLHKRVYRHRVGTDPDTDELVYGEGAERGTYFGLRTSRDGRWLVMTTRRGTDSRNDLWLVDLSTGGPPVEVMRGVDAQAYGRMHDDRLIIWTDRDAPRGRICVADPAAPADWTDLVPEDPEAVLDPDLAIVDGAGLLAVTWRRHAVGAVSLHDLATGSRVSDVEFPGLGTVDGLTARPEGGTELWIGYTDYATPPHVLRWSSGELVVDVPPPGDVNRGAVPVRQVVYTSADGTPVRMFVIGSGSGPTVLNGYGGFTIPLVPIYSPMALAWVRAGGVWAVANLRGGTEEGEQWHRDGMRDKKQNVFDDFHAAARWLRDNGVATRLGIVGGSNGGLLMGAALTQKPELYDAVLCSAPLLDMVRYEKFGIGPMWTGEYGSAEVAEEFGWLYAYSPYHRVVEGTDYPPVLFTVFEGDSRVDTMHARKMTAALQHATTGARGPILLRREIGVGHASRAVSRTVELNADTLGFFAHYLWG